jgi:probable O-glycosylation ligase (exosortase A-associated)
MGRINAWHFAINLANDRPILGGGFGTFTRDLFQIYAPNPDDVHDSHSIYFEVLAEQGYVGLILFLLIFYLTLRSCKWIIRHSKNDESRKWAYDLAAMIQVSLIGYAVGGAFLGLAYFDLPYNLVAIVVITRLIISEQLSASEHATGWKHMHDSDPTRRVHNG